jgi:hypothetical protein
VLWLETLRSLHSSASLTLSNEEEWLLINQLNPKSLPSSSSKG